MQLATSLPLKATAADHCVSTVNSIQWDFPLCTALRHPTAHHPPISSTPLLCRPKISLKIFSKGLNPVAAIRLATHVKLTEVSN